MLRLNTTPISQRTQLAGLGFLWGRSVQSYGTVAIGCCLILLSAGCDRSDSRRGSSVGLSAANATPPPSAITLGAGQEFQPSPKRLDQSRSTAIVTAASRVAPAVVTVNVIRTEVVRGGFFDMFAGTRRVSGLGSGFIVNEDGLIITNEHVVAGAERIMVTLQDGRNFSASVVGTDQLTDIALLQIDESGIGGTPENSTAGDPLPVAPIGTSEGLLIGEWAVAIGNPFGNLFSNTEATVTAGVISAVGRHILGGSDEGAYLGMIQTDAAINPGNSGGPLINASGEVIGVNSSIFSRGGGSEGLGFAIPIDRVLLVAEDLQSFGTVRRPWLGLEVTDEVADEWGRTRVVVSRVVEDSPAADAGIRPGTILMAADDRRLLSPLDFDAAMLDLRAGDEVALALEDGQVSVVAELTPTSTADRVEVIDGFEVISVTEAIQVEKGLVSDSGALIVSISNQLSSQLGLQVGDVLLRINRFRVEDGQDAREALNSLPRGQVVLTAERDRASFQRSFILR